MTAPVTVSISIKDITGTALPRARVMFERTAADFDGEIIAPAAKTATCDADGVGSIELHPNTTGSEGTQYRVTIVDENGDLQYSGLATVPATDSGLHTLLGLASPAAVSDVGAVAGIAANVTTVAGIAANVTTVAGVAANVTTVAGVAANVTTVAGISGDVTTVADAAANVATVAGDIADVSTVATSIADVTSAATNMAAIQAAPTQAASAASSAADAAASASAAAASAAIFGHVGAPASDLVPSRHLSNLAGKTSATVVIVGDSTMTGAAVNGNFVDPAQTLWSLIQEKLRADNPQITSWTFTNFAIGGANESHLTQTGAASGLTRPAWFTDASQTWISYVQAAAPDVVFYGFGTNAATSGLTAGNNAAVFIRQNMENMAGWTAPPNVVVITTKDANPDTDASGDDANLSAHQAQAAFHRTFARTNAAGYTSFAALQAKGFGLIDLGENYSRSVRGFSPRSQYLQSVPSAIVASAAMGAWAQAAGASTVARTTNGDFRLAFRVLNGGGTTLFGYGGGNLIKVSLSPFIGNYLRLAIGGSGAVSARYVLDGGISGAPMQTGASVATTLNQDVNIVVSLVGTRLIVTVEGTTSLDIQVPRFYGPVPSGLPVNVGFGSAPVNSPTMAVDEFWEGISTRTSIIIPATEAFGASATWTAATADCRGGNAQNHVDSRILALDRMWIESMNMAA